jgi:serine/threonine protein kinase
VLSVLDVGDRLAGFEIEAYVARGGMAVVYRAREVGLGGRMVALKVIAPELAQDPTFRLRFTQESQLAASIDHPNIIPIYAAGEADGQLYLVMRYVDGETLGAVFKDQGQLGPAETLAVFTQVAGALDAAHAHELVHRDVKPKNILLAGKGDVTRRHVYLSDFGLTKRVSGDTSITTAGQFLGTIRYVAPEQISNAPISHRADIYSLACVIVEGLTGQPPFTSEDEAAVLWSHMSQDPPAVSQRRPDLPIAVDGVLRRALAKDPVARQQTCQELVAELRSALQPAPVLTGPTAETVLLSTLSPSRDEPVTVSNASPASSGSTDTVPRPYAARQPTDPEPHTVPDAAPSPHRRNSLPFVVVGLLLVGVIAGIVLAVVQSRRVVAGPAASSSPSATPSPSPSPSASPASLLPQSAEPLADDTLVWRYEDGGRWTIATVSVDSDARQVLLRGRPRRGVQLTPDRRTILYLHENSKGVITLRAMAADGTKDRALFKDGSPACPRMSRPTVRADGLLALVCVEVPGGRGVLNLMKTDGTLVRVLARGRLGDPAFTPDGNEITYWSADTDGVEGGSLHQVRVDGKGKPERLLPGEDGEFSDPTWSPSGERLLATRTRGDLSEIIEIDINDGGPVETASLTTGHLDKGPSWSPDESQILFRRGTDDVSDIYVMSADGMDDRQIFHSEGYASEPVWTAQ